MKVLVTGAAGNLGRVVLPALSQAGHEPLGFDGRPANAAYPWIQGDVRDLDALRRATTGVDAIVHGAALHGVHLHGWAPADFWTTNANGTFNVYEAAREQGITHVVLSSTMGVYGLSLRRTQSAFAWTSEADPILPTDIYGLSKQVCEELGRYHARANGMTTVALRFGMYVPDSFVRYGFRLLFGGVDDRDVAQAVLRALTHRPENGFDYFNIMAETPFQQADAAAIATEPEALLERYWPGTRELLRERSIDVGEQIWGETLWPIEKAKRILGYSPEYDFGRFLQALRARDDSIYPFAGLPQWGV